MSPTHDLQGWCLVRLLGRIRFSFRPLQKTHITVEQKTPGSRQYGGGDERVIGAILLWFIMVYVVESLVNHTPRRSETRKSKI